MICKSPILQSDETGCAAKRGKKYKAATTTGQSRSVIRGF
jgi:hypothetical protein